jgi:hypothetical protein
MGWKKYVGENNQNTINSKYNWNHSTTHKNYSGQNELDPNFFRDYYNTHDVDPRFYDNDPNSKFYQDYYSQYDANPQLYQNEVDTQFYRNHYYNRRTEDLKSNLNSKTPSLIHCIQSNIDPRFNRNNKKEMFKDTSKTYFNRCPNGINYSSPCFRER